ncbi:MAG: PAS domain-containing sensor histidine kinase [Anaerolineae bacterium]|nr:PAS domain-containing sensor histidine kinase [Anaerolineae bacterium]
MADPLSDNHTRLKQLVTRRTRQSRRFYTRLRRETRARKQLEVTVNHLEARLSTLLQTIDEFVILFQFSPQGRPVPQWQSLSTTGLGGYTRAELAQLGGVEKLVHPADRKRAEEILRTVAMGERITADIRIVDKDERVRWVRLRQVPVWDETHTNVTHFYSFSRDITSERHEIDQQGHFLSNAIHELAHPVSNLTLRLYLMQRQAGNMSEHLEMLESVTGHLRLMVEQMRELAYIGNNQVFVQPKPMIVQRFLSDLIEAHRPQAASRNLKLTLETSQDPLEVFIDPQSISRALGYLITDAINTSVDAQEVLIQVVEQPDQAPTSIEISIHHHGPHDANAGDMFTPFYRSSQGDVVRTGLELAIAKGLIELHGARVMFHSDTDGHREFRVWLLPA